MKAYRVRVMVNGEIIGNTFFRASDVSIAVKRALSGWTPHSEKGDITTAGGRPIKMKIDERITITAVRVA